MGDDPYDFDIAIPSGKTVAKGKAWDGGRHAASDDSDVSESSRGGASDSGSGSDPSLSESEDFRGKKKVSAASKTPARRSGGGATAPAKSAAGAGSTALDKAKSFLSKYSTKPTAVTATKAATSTRSRRLEMSLDDEDFSLDSSGEEIQKPKATAAAVTSKARVVRKESSESEQDEAEESTEPYTKPVTKPRYEDSDEDVEDRPQPVAARVEMKPVTAAVVNRYDSDDDTADSQAPVRATSNTWAPAGYGATQSKPIVKEDDDDDAESIASQSEMDESVDVPRALAPAGKPQPVVAPILTTAKPRQISAVSESGVYEEEDFEDDSVQASAAPAKDVEPVKASAPASRLREEESNFDYSLDFAEDQESSPPPFPTSSGVKTVIEERNDDEREEDQSRSSSSSSKSNRNSYVDDGDGDEDGEGYGQSREYERVPAASEVAIGASKPTPLQESENYSQDYGFESASTVMTTIPAEENPKAVESRVAAPANTTTDSTIPGSAPSMHHVTSKGSMPDAQVTPPSVVAMPPTQSRSRVVIVREYEQQSTSVEKRDASTQFTGNHAGIQTDLTPDGMFSSAERKSQSHAPVVDYSHPQVLATDHTPSSFSSIPPAPPLSQPPASVPGPPPSPFMTYGLYDPLQLPVATSMSIYKQQLMALQQQIHQKKLETERLFCDRMTSRYSSLRGTDKFLASHRPTRIPLWEALQRVDPSLDERRAKEIASLAGDAAS